MFTENNVKINSRKLQRMVLNLNRYFDMSAQCVIFIFKNSIILFKFEMIVNELILDLEPWLQD